MMGVKQLKTRLRFPGTSDFCNFREREKFCVSMTSPCSFNRNTTFCKIDKMVEANYGNDIFWETWPMCPPGCAHSIMAFA